jgi:predicted nuclease of predicted toxin-antitoxin system
MHFMLDENIPMDVADMLRAHGHKVEWIRDYVLPGSPDPLVATVSEEMTAILVSSDGDFEKIAPRVSQGQRARFRRLSRIWLRCSEPQAAQRLEKALDFIEAEFELAQKQADKRMNVWISNSFLRTNR